MRIAIGTDDPGRRLLVLQCRVLKRIHILRAGDLILLKIDCVDEVIPECGIARLVLIFVVTNEKSLVAAGTVIHADILHPPEIACEWPLMALALRHVVL